MKNSTKGLIKILNVFNNFQANLLFRNATVTCVISVDRRISVDLIISVVYTIYDAWFWTKFHFEKFAQLVSISEIVQSTRFKTLEFFENYRIFSMISINFWSVLELAQSTRFMIQVFKSNFILRNSHTQCGSQKQCSLHDL